jgi:hypothetical protein
MKRVLQATDIYSAVWPLHFVSRIFGLAPYSLKPDSQSAKHATFVTCFSRMWSVLCIVLLAALGYIFITGSVFARVTLKQKIRNTIFNTSQFSCPVINLFLSLTLNRGKVPQILRQFSEIDQLLSSKMYRIQIYKNTRLYLTVRFLTMIFVFIIMYVPFFTHIIEILVLQKKFCYSLM